MSAAAPWSVKGIEPKAREIAKDLARRSGMTLGEWLNTMIMEDDDEGVVPLSRRPHAADSYERRGRSRRVEDAYGGGEEPWHRLSASIDAIAARLEAAERRSTVAIQGVDQAVSGLVRRLDNQDQDGKGAVRRIDDIAEELREGHKRLRRFEQEVGPRTAETFGKVETTLGALAGRLYDIEERQRTGVNELRQRMDSVEKTAGPGVGADLLGQVGTRLDQAQGRTAEALRGLERSFAGLDQRLRATEGRVEPESAREAARFEKLAETLSRQVEGNRVEMMRRLDTAEAEGRMDRIERAVLAIGDQVKTSEQSSAKAVEAMGHEVLRIAQNLNGRVGRIEGDMGRVVQGVEQRLVAADDRHALALEKLGGEITRISDRLSERIAQSERRSQQALEDIGRRLADSSSRIEQGYDRASGELAERMRLSEERTAALIAEARGSIDSRAEPAKAITPVAQPDWRSAAFPDAPFSDAVFADAGFEDPEFEAQQAWSADLAPPEPESEIETLSFAARATAEPVLDAAAIFDAVMRGPIVDAPAVAAAPTTPFGSPVPDSSISTSPIPTSVAAAREPGAIEVAPVAPVFSSPSAFGQARPETPARPGPDFGGADVSDALAATDPEGLDGDHDDFHGESDFVDPRALRAAAAQGRASSTRQAIDAARAAMIPAEAPPRQGFGLKRGGKSKLQERLDKQAARGGDTVRKALGASGVAVLLTAGGALAFGELTGAGLHIPGLNTGGPTGTPAFAALATTPTDATPLATEQAEALYEKATALLDAGDGGGLDMMRRSADLGYTPAQTHLAALYESGDGVTADPAQARLWVRRAAEGGDVKAMHNYGIYLFEGVGAAPDPAGALEWLRRAAAKGLVDSQYNVAKLYEDGGTGIRPNLTQAYTWYLIAARGGDGEAQAAVDRLRAALPAATRTSARAEADRFQVEPLA